MADPLARNDWIGTREDRWTDILPQSWQSAINTNPMVNALARYMQPRQSFDQYAREWQDNIPGNSPIDRIAEGRSTIAKEYPSPMNPLAADMLEKGGFLANFLAPGGVRLPGRPQMMRAPETGGSGQFTPYPEKSFVAPGASELVPGRYRIPYKDGELSYKMMDDGTANLSIYTMPEGRGQGEARKALQNFIAAADASKQPLSLEVSPGAPGISADRLRKLYSGLGFEGPDYYMVRQPAAPKPQNVTAYHGSPHDFDTFKTPAFFSATEGPAMQYRRMGGAGGGLAEGGGAPIRDRLYRDAATAMNKYGTREEAVAALEKTNPEAAKYLANGGNAGTMYEVSIPKPTGSYVAEVDNHLPTLQRAQRDGHKVIELQDGPQSGKELVVLDPTMIEILRKYGLLPPLAAGGAAAADQLINGEGGSGPAIAGRPGLGVMIPKAQAPKPAGIKAYHGSPHDFDRFDISKIGTGEGAQAYGRGLYFAEAEGTAKSYRDTLSRGGASSQLNARDQARLEYAQPFLEAANWDRTAAADLADKAARGGWLKKPDPLSAQKFQEAASFLRDEALPIGNKGRMYEVRINADPERFLQFDRPFREQTPEVQSVLRRYTRPDVPDESMETILGNAAQKIRQSAWLPSTKQDPHAKIASSLQDAGVPGIRYKDAMSRNATPQPLLDGQPIKGNEAADTAAVVLRRNNGDIDKAVQELQRSAASFRNDPTMLEAANLLQNKRVSLGEAPGTNNYVVFDDALIQILRKYGLLPPVAAGAAQVATQGQDTAF